MTTAMRIIRELDALAFRAWPAQDVVELDGWQLRYMAGVTRRANSAWPAKAGVRLSLAERIAALESFYGERELPARVQMSPGALPEGLDAALRKRGFGPESAVSIQTASLTDLLQAASPEPGGIRIQVAVGPFDVWRSVAVSKSRFAETPEVLEGLVARLAGAALCTVALVEDEPAAAVLGVRDGAWLGVFAMLTLPEHRRRGVGTALLRGLCEAARATGVERTYLQVERSNPAALALYAGLGFREVYGYYYLTKPPPIA